MNAGSLPYVNLALFALQIAVNANQNAFSPNDTAPAFTTDTLIRPAGYAFLIWLVIYVFTALLVVTDAFFPHLAFYSNAQSAGVLRTCFAASCVVNMLWVVLFNWLRWVHVAAVDLTLLWLAMLPLYLFVVKAANSDAASWTQFVLSELAVRLYFAWVTAAVLLNVAIAAQTASGAFLSLRAYVAMLAVLSVLVLAGVVLGRDPVIGFVGLWALVALARRADSSFTGATHDDFVTIQACALFSAMVLAAFVVIATVQRVMHPTTRWVALSSEDARKPLLS